MTDHSTGPTASSGAVWPSTPAAFIDLAVCPRCFSPLDSSVCRRCALDLNVPLAQKLYASSTDLVAADALRRSILERMWTEQLTRKSTRAEVSSLSIPVYATFAPRELQHPAQVLARATSSQTSPSQRSTLPIPPMPSLPPVPAAHRRSGVQVFLLVAGITLISIFALFFLALAYLISSAEVRAAVTALAGLVLFGAATLLRRRRLPGTAEGVAVAATVVLLADLAFVRGSELFGSTAVDPTLFAGVGLLVITAVLTLVHRLGDLRLGTVGSALLAPVGLTLAVVGLLHPVDEALAWFAGLLAAGGATVMLFWRDRPVKAETTITRLLAFIALSAALVPAALLLPEAAGLSAIAYTLLATVFALFDGRLSRRRDSAAWGTASSIGLGVAAALAPSVAILRTTDIAVSLWAPGAASAVVATVLVVVARRSPSRVLRQLAAWAWPAAVLIAAAGLLPGAFLSFVHVATSLGWPGGLWQASPLDEIAPLPAVGSWAAVLAPAASALLLACLIRLVGLPRSIRATASSLAGLALLGAASHGGTVLLELVGYALVALTCLVLLVVTRSRSAPDARIPTAVTLALAIFAVIALSPASAALWIPAIVVALALLWGSRSALNPTAGASRAARGGITALASVIALSTSLLVVPWFNEWRPRFGDFAGYRPAVADIAGFTAVISALILVAAALFVRRRARSLDLRAASIVALVFAIPCTLVTVVVPGSGAFGEIVALTAPLLLATAGILWQLRASVASWLERVVLAAVTPLAIAATMTGAVGLLPRPPASGTVEALVAGTTIGATVIALLVLRRPANGLVTPARLAWECSTGVLVIVVAATSLAATGDLTWVSLVLLAVVPLLVACGDGNPLTGNSPRRHVAWAAAALVVTALWQHLTFVRVRDVEPYTLPIALLLLSLCLVVTLVRPIDRRGSPGRTVLLATGLAMLLAPSSIGGIATESPLRAAALLAVGSVLVLVALVSAQTPRALRLRATSLTAGLATLTVVGLTRGTYEAVRAGGLPLFSEWWALPAVVALVTTGTIWTHRRALPFAVARGAVPAALVVFGIAEVVAILTAWDPTIRATRIALTSVILVVVAICAAARSRVPLDAVTRYTALGVLAVVAIVSVASPLPRFARPTPIELSTVPLALALIGAGLVQLRRSRASRTWPHLGPGLGLLLVPSLLHDFGGNDLWRVVALGLLCIAIVTASIILRWQAPLVLAGCVLIVHAIAQSWPWIQGLYSAVPWWIWIGVGGVLLVVLAARYEHRVKNLRSFVGTISALR